MECNNQKMREAVVALLDALDSLGCDEDTAALAAFVPGMEDSSAKCLAAFRKAKDALAAPERNCDRRFASIKEARTAYCLECGRIVSIWDGYESRLFEDWLLASAAERKGGSDGV